MSSGSFLIRGYETNAGDVRPIRVQPETIIAAVNPEAPGTTEGAYVRVSGGNRRYGLKARSVTLKQNVGAAVDGYQPTKTIRLPILQLASFSALNLGQTVAYNGSNWVVAGLNGERGR